MYINIYYVLLFYATVINMTNYVQPTVFLFKCS